MQKIMQIQNFCFNTVCEDTSISLFPDQERAERIQYKNILKATYNGTIMKNYNKKICFKLYLLNTRIILLNKYSQF